MNSIIKKQGLLKIILGFSAASWISAALNFISLPISTRLFDPSQLASINLFYAIFTLIAWFACLGLDQGYIRFFNENETENDRKNLLSVCMAMSILALIAITLIAIPFRGNISFWILNKEGNENLIYFLFICALNAVVIRYLSMLHRMKNNVFLYTITVICSSSVIKLSYLVAALYDAHHLTAILIMFLVSLFCLIITLVGNKKNLNFKISIRKNLSKKVFLYSIPFMPISVMSLLNNDLPQYLLRSLDDISNLGIYTTAVTLAGIITLLQSGLGVFWGPYVYKNYKNKAEKIKKMHELIVFAMVFSAVLIISFQDIIVLLLGEKYRVMTAFFPFLLISPVCYTIAETTGVGIAIEKKSNINLAIYSFSVVSNIIACYIFIPLYSLEGAAMSSASAAIIMLIFKTLFGQKYYKSIDKYRYTIIGMFALVAVSSINVLFKNDIWICIIFNLVSLIGLSMVFKINLIVKSFRHKAV
ncbi:lipopolysaccharide biosynthesis protein [Paenibacillus luteus]|uniref:lipopolysaccharide biosynthesis protein n=1 Tax=Paenibacillus luteus TaxID=2545753 RepID=UPI001375E63D|nr:oligosaccharide flippase family protein [Paenibacillus luteus]